MHFKKKKLQTDWRIPPQTYKGQLTPHDRISWLFYFSSSGCQMWVYSWREAKMERKRYVSTFLYTRSTAPRLHLPASRKPDPVVSRNRKWVVKLWPLRAASGHNPLSSELSACHCGAGRLSGRPGEEGSSIKYATALKLSKGTSLMKCRQRNHYISFDIGKHGGPLETVCAHQRTQQKMKNIKDRRSRASPPLWSNRLLLSSVFVCEGSACHRLDRLFEFKCLCSRRWAALPNLNSHAPKHPSTSLEFSNAALIWWNIHASKLLTAKYPPHTWWLW